MVWGSRRDMGTAAPAGKQFPSEPPPNDTATLTPLGQLQKRRSPRSSTHHLLPLSTAKHPSQARDSTLQMGCHGHLGLSLSPGSCGHGATGHARYQDYFFTYAHPPTPIPFLISPPLFGGSRSLCSLTHSPPCSGPCRIGAILPSSVGDILLLSDYFHTSMPTGVSPILNFGLDLKLPEMLVAFHQAGKAQFVSKCFT